MMENVKIVCLPDGTKLVTLIEEVSADIGEPDCKMSDPFEIIIEGDNLPIMKPWLSDYTTQSVFMIHSDKILTITEPRPTLLEKYQSLTK